MLMFVTHPQCSFPVPKGLGPPFLQYWRSFSLIGMRSFFVATFQVGSNADGVHQTWCISSELDLIERLRQLPSEPLVGLVWLCPPWLANAQNWTARSIAQVWQGVERSMGTPVVLLIDDQGGEFVPAALPVVPSMVEKREPIAELRRPTHCNLSSAKTAPNRHEARERAHDNANATSGSAA